MLERKVVFVEPKSYDLSEEEEEFEPVDSGAFAEVSRRSDDIDQLTADYIINLMGLEEEGIDGLDIGLTAEILEKIEDAFEETLNAFGITIYRPVIVEDEFGREVVKPNIFES